MTKEKDLCPMNSSGEHRYFMFKISEVFVPFEGKNKSVSTQLELKNTCLYEKKEYATMGCNCGSAIKSEVKQK
jgi:hypothetical protein